MWLGMEEASWWPRGLARGSMEDALSNQELTTKWGKLSCFDVRETMEPSWSVSYTHLTLPTKA